MSVAAGGGITYTLTHTNAGDQIAMGVIITEAVPDCTTFSAAASTPDCSCPDGSPAGTVCTFPVGDLVPGGGGSVRFVVTVDDPLPEGATETPNTASIGEDKDSDGTGRHHSHQVDRRAAGDVRAGNARNQAWVLRR